MSFSGYGGYQTKPKPGVMLNPLHPLSQGVVGYWLFNEGSGSQAYDLSGKGNHGTLTNMLPNAQGSGWGGSKFGGGLQFDGSNDFIDCGLAPETDLDGAITLVAGINRTGDGSSHFPAIITKRADVNNAYSLRYRPFLNVAQLFIGSGAEYKIISTNGDLDIGTDYILIGTWDGTNMLLYLNGILQTNTDTTSGTPDTSGADLWIGNFYTDQHYPYEGLVNFSMIYNRALPPKEVLKLSKNPFCNLLQVPMKQYSVAAPPIGAIMNQFQRANIGADLYNGVFA